MEAVKQGSATVGLKSNTHAVVVALKRASSELSGQLFIMYLHAVASVFAHYFPVLRIRIRICMFLGLLDPDPDPIVDVWIRIFLSSSNNSKKAWISTAFNFVTSFFLTSF
jgi:hypothetical protein